MRFLATSTGLFLISFGVIAVCWPGSFITLGYHVLTPLGLYAVAALRIGIGCLLIAAASAARMPKTMRIMGAIILLAGLATPFVGLHRTQAVLDWFARQGSLPSRLSLCAMIAIGVFIFYAFRPQPGRLRGL